MIGLLDDLRSYVASAGSLGAGRIGTYVRYLRRYLDLQRALIDYRYVTALLLAARLELFAHLGERPITGECLAEATGTDPSALETLLNVLEAKDVVERRPDGWVLSPFAAAFLTDDAPATEAPFLRLLGDYAESFPDIERALRTGEAPAQFDIRRDGPSADRFLDAVNSYMDRAGLELVHRAEMPQVDHLIVGSMGVSFSAHILRHFDGARVTYGCLEHLTERIPRLRNEYGVDPTRVVDTHAHSGEPADDRWGREAFDLVFLTKKMILDPADGVGEKFARKAHRVLEPGGTAIFWEAFHHPDGETPEGLALESLFDLGVTPDAGPLYRPAFRDRLERIGFDDVEFVDCLGGATSFALAHRH